MKMNEIIIDDLLKFYKKELSLKNLIFKKNLFLNVVSGLLFFAPIIIVIVVVSFFLLKGYEGLFYSAIVSIISAFFLMVLFNWLAKKVMKKEYRIKKIEKRIWNEDIQILKKISDLQRDELRIKLQNSYDISEVKEIKDIMKETVIIANKRRFKISINILSLGALLGPLWVVFLNWLFNNDNISELSDGIYLFITVLGIIVCFYIILIFLSYVKKELKGLLNREHVNLIELHTCLGNVGKKIEKENKIYIVSKH